MCYTVSSDLEEKVLNPSVAFQSYSLSQLSELRSSQVRGDWGSNWYRFWNKNWMGEGKRTKDSSDIVKEWELAGVPSHPLLDQNFLYFIWFHGKFNTAWTVFWCTPTYTRRLDTPLCKISVRLYIDILEILLKWILFISHLFTSLLSISLWQEEGLGG